MNSNISKDTTEHTPEPWESDLIYVVAPCPNGVHPDIYIAEIAHEDSESRIASPKQQKANLRRIVACVNACQGIPTEALEQGMIKELLKSMETYISSARKPNW